MNRNYQKLFLYASYIISPLLIIYAYSGLTDSQFLTFFNADTLYLPSIYKDLFIDKTGIEGWHLNAAPNFFPDMFLFFILNTIVRNFKIVFMLFSIIQYITIIGLLNYLIILIKKDTPAIYLAGINFLFSIFLFVTLIPTDFMLSFYVLSNIYHLGAFVMCLLALVFTYKFLTEGVFKNLVILFIIISLGTLSDRLFLAYFTMPIFAVCLFLFLGQNRKNVIYLTVTLVTSTTLGLLLFRLLKLSKSIHIIGLHWKYMNFENIGGAFNVLMGQMAIYFKTFNLRAFILYITIATFIISIILLFNNLKKYQANKNNNSYLILTSYLIFHITFSLVVFFMPVINGSYIGWAILRYNISTFYLGVLNFVFVLYLLLSLYNKEVFLRYSIYVLSVLIIGFAIIFPFKNNIATGLSNLKNYYPDYVKKIDEIAVENDLKYGLDTYWTAKPITLLSKKGVRVYTIREHSKIWYHVMNENWYYKNGKGKYGIPEFKFIITSDIDTVKLKEYIGAPLKRIAVDDESFVFVYDEFEIDKKTRAPKLISETEN